ncbi:LPXTG cell wall anchor domain-containing protein [Kitasatospora sp. A2-31]|uniref:LPXTG cell wall anchor domain-containing protein n=1 Tax=Kitasatospora sp. A2-31 TaxID=2916414 RepID=UPI001EECF02C|nr:LPXTG cell wall anchor domain-containing protein [Kitasatospora sp. A2-31]MCG6494537.1 LPXTG cell wall anchor domain-containing protein [Kitasatospora sp. A2-31]
MSKSIRRSFALAGAAALASSMVLAGAQSAVAAGTTGSPSAAAAPQADKAAHNALDLSVAGVPSTFIAGGESKQFTFKVDNATKHDFVFYPFLKFKNREGSLEADHLKVEYQLPGGSWLPAGVAPGGGDSDDDAVLIMLGGVDGEGNVDGGALLAVNRGKSLNITVRVSFTNDAPLGKAGVVPVVFSEQLDDKTGEAVGNGHFSCDGIKGAGFTIKAGGGKPSPTAKPTTAKPTTAKPSPTATKPTGSPTASQSPTATATPSASTSPTATATATATSTATPSATATPSTTASPSATTSPTTAPTETAKPTGPATSAPATSPAATAPVATTSAGPQEPIDFPVAVPNVTPPKLTPAAVSGAKTAADKALATTGGGDDTTAIAIAGGAVLAAGAGTLLVLRRRKSAQQG